MQNPTRSSATVVQIVVNPGGTDARAGSRAPGCTATGNGALVPGVKSATLISLCVVTQSLNAPTARGRQTHAHARREPAIRRGGDRRRRRAPRSVSAAGPGG